jgi:WD40 repeat protein
LPGADGADGSPDGVRKFCRLAERTRFSGHTGPVQNVAITRDGKFGLSSSADKTVRLWDLQTGKELPCFTGHTGGVLGVAISPDGKFGLSGSWDNTVRLWRRPDPPPAQEKP